MTARCYVHSTTSTGIPGKHDDRPFGSCNICGGLACEMHGARQSSYPRFVCVLCVPALLTATALAGADVPEVLRALTNSALLQHAGIFESVDQFVDELPDLSWAAEDALARLSIASSWFTTDETEPLWFAIDTDRQALIMTAVVLSRSLQIPLSELPEPLRPFVVQVTDQF